MAQPKPVLVHPLEIQVVEKVRRELRAMSKSLQMYKHNYPVLKSFVEKLAPGNFEGRNYPENISEIYQRADFLIRTIGDLDSRLGEAVHKIQKGDQSVVTKTVRKVELGTDTAEPRKRAAIVGSKG